VETAAEVRSFVLQRIQHIYERPLMYGGSPECVDTILANYHELVEVIDARDRNVLFDAQEIVQKSIGCPGAMCFGEFCRQNADGKTDTALAQEIVALWKRVDLELDHDRKN
jgi:hypothetical protein